jgi:TonB family protein
MIKYWISQKKELSIRSLSLPFVLFAVLFGIQGSFLFAGNRTVSGTPGSGIAYSNKEMILVTCSDEVNQLIARSAEIEKMIIDYPQFSAQQKNDGEDDVYISVDNMPEFPGGDLGLRKFIAKAIKYPNIAMEKSIQGRVFVKYTVNKDGSVSDAKIARGVDPSLDKEALRVIMSLPKWKPGMQNGKAVRVSLMFPITFQLMQVFVLVTPVCQLMIGDGY